MTADKVSNAVMPDGNIDGGGREIERMIRGEAGSVLIERAEQLHKTWCAERRGTHVMTE